MIHAHENRQNTTGTSPTTNVNVGREADGKIKEVKVKDEKESKALLSTHVVMMKSTMHMPLTIQTILHTHPMHPPTSYSLNQQWLISHRKVAAPVLKSALKKAAATTKKGERRRTLTIDEALVKKLGQRQLNPVSHTHIHPLAQPHLICLAHQSVSFHNALKGDDEDEEENEDEEDDAKEEENFN